MAKNNFIIKIPVWIITIYQHIIGPIFPRVCRFHPTCSEYTKQALIKYGLTKGLLIGIRRILRCNPFNAGGYDPITGAEK
jgi:putative membrane protein insertion efficiency factor